MAHITHDEVNAWLDHTKLALPADTDVEAALEEQVSSMIFSRLAGAFPTSANWADASTTPDLVRTIIAMYYVAALYDRSYSDDVPNDTSNYAALLRTMADANIAGLLSGFVTLPEDPSNAATSVPTFFPNDASSANEPSSDFPSDGPPAFMMGTTF